MASLVGYASSDEGCEEGPPRFPAPMAVIAAPEVSVAMSTQLAQIDMVTREAQGPSNPFKPDDGNALKRKNVPTGRAEEIALSDAIFNAHHRTFQSMGYAQDPSKMGAFVGDQAKAIALGGRDSLQARPNKAETRRVKRQKRGDAGIVDGEGAYRGPWAKFEEQAHTYDYEAVPGEELGSDEEYVEDEIEAAQLGPAGRSGTDYQDDIENTETTEFHGSEQYDYQGRTYMHVPQDLDIDLSKEPGSQKNYHPKKIVHTWKSHTKAITSLNFLPGSGHLLLSASADAKIKIWDVYHSRELLRTYSGHNKAVTSVEFIPSGAQFVSAAYDHQIKLWDTEYGKCVSRFSVPRVANVIKVNPSAPHEFLAGMSDNRILQYDTRSGEMAQDYDHHTKAVNTITFCDENRRFITTSDDKSLRAWEYNIPVPIKFIAEPEMFALTRASPHPSGKYVLFQSGDNQIVVYASTDRFRQNRKKNYRGHNTAGNAIDVAVSPDGGMVMSGDSGGYVCFWDFKTCKMWHKIKASDGPLVRAQWHPQETSKVVTGGVDGLIKYWD